MIRSWILAKTTTANQILNNSGRRILSLLWDNEHWAAGSEVTSLMRCLKTANLSLHYCVQTALTLIYLHVADTSRARGRHRGGLSQSMHCM